MIDIHSHLIPEIDDGSQSVDQSLATLERFAAVGVRDVILTPHLRATELNLDPEDALERRTAAYVPLERRAPEQPRLHLGFEIMLDQPVPAAAAADRRFSLAGSRYYLVEFPFGVAARTAALALEHVIELGIVPVVAHPERYHACSAQAVADWRRLGAKIQVDGTTLTRNSSRGRHARQLVAAGLADVLAADNHGDGRTLQTAVRFLTDRGFAETAHRLTVDNARAILEDQELTDCRPVRLKERFWSRVKGLIGY